MKELMRRRCVMSFISILCTQGTSLHDADRISSSISDVLLCSVTFFQLTRPWRQVDVVHGALEGSLEDRAKISTIFQAGELNMNSTICNETLRSNLARCLVLYS